MRQLNPITLDGTVFIDNRSKLSRLKQRRLQHEYKLEFEKRFDAVNEASGVEPGCEAVRNSTARKEFDKVRDIEKDYPRFRKKLEEGRICADPRTDESFTLLADDGTGAVGGIMIYNVTVVGRNRGIIEYTAGCGPILKDVDTIAAFMLYLLDNPTDGVNDAGEAITMQLVEWTFPIEDVRNRWDVSRLRPAVWVRQFQRSAGHTVLLETRGSQEFITSLKIRSR